MLSMQNPFESSIPVTDPARFYGHRNDLQRIITRVGAERPQSMSVIGEKAMGKSSLLNTLTHPDTRARHLSKPEAYLFGQIRLRERDDWTPSQFIQSFTAAVRERHADVPEASDYDGFRALIQHLDSEGLCLIGFFDDFDVITQNPDFPLTFFSFLRSMANTYNVAYVTSSSESLQRLCVSKDVEESPFFNIFTNIVLKPLEENEVRRWVIEGSNPSGLSLSSEAEWIYAQVGGFPGLVRELCKSLWERKHVRGKVRKSNLKEIEIAFQEQAGDALESIWGGLSQREQELCAHLLTSDELDRPQTHLIRDMTRRGYVQEAEGSYTLFGRAFERFVADKMGIEITSDQSQKRRWWPFGK